MKTTRIKRAKRRLRPETSCTAPRGKIDAFVIPSSQFQTNLGFKTFVAGSGLRSKRQNIEGNKQKK